MLRKVDLRLGGGGNGNVSGVMGNGGNLMLVLAWRSLWSNSTNSMAVRVKVRLCVGAVGCKVFFSQIST